MRSITRENKAISEPSHKPVEALNFLPSGERNVPQL
jgi:hypothetical protein